MTGPTIILAVPLRAGASIRAGHRYDITNDMNSRQVWRDWRALVGQRRAGEHILVTVTVDGVPVGQWNADATWPRASADAIADARAQRVPA